MSSNVLIQDLLDTIKTIWLTKKQFEMSFKGFRFFRYLEVFGLKHENHMGVNDFPSIFCFACCFYFIITNLVYTCTLPVVIGSKIIFQCVILKVFQPNFKSKYYILFRRSNFLAYIYIYSAYI